MTQEQIYQIATNFINYFNDNENKILNGLNILLYIMILFFTQRMHNSIIQFTNLSDFHNY